MGKEDTIGLSEQLCYRSGTSDELVPDLDPTEQEYPEPECIHIVDEDLLPANVSKVGRPSFPYRVKPKVAKPNSESDPSMIQGIVEGKHQIRRDSDMPQSISAARVKSDDEYRTERVVILDPEGILSFKSPDTIHKQGGRHVQDFEKFPQVDLEAMYEDGDLIAPGTLDSYQKSKKQKSGRRVPNTQQFSFVSQERQALSKPDSDQSMIGAALYVQGILRLARIEVVKPHIVKQNPQKAG